MLRLVIDTNIWIRILLRGRVTLPILNLWQTNQFQLITSQALLDEFANVWQRPRLSKLIDPLQAQKLYRQMRSRAEIVELKTIPPFCRDPKDQPV
jgi:putative PIN family toxin of toxin-antitoxin system